MQSIPSPDALRPGDVVHHAAFGFAAVAAVDDHGASLRWERAGANLPARVSWHGLTHSYRRCAHEGLFALSVLDPAASGRLLAEDPVSAVGHLLEELGGAALLADLREWLAGRWGPDGFDAWWDAALLAVAADPRFHLGKERASLAEGVAFGALGAEPSPEEAPVILEAPPPPLRPEPLDPERTEAWLLGLARRLGALHATGRAMLRRIDLLPSDDGPLPADPDARFDPRGDVRWLARHALLRALGLLPPPEDLGDSVLLGGLPLVLPLSPEVVGVLTRALAGEAGLRPPDGTALWLELGAALERARARALAPSDGGAEVRVGFDTHIGTVKSLAGQTNQDALLLAGDPSLALLGVADGISTSNAGTGDLASSLLVRTLRAAFAADGPKLAGASATQVRAHLRGGLERANTVVCQTAQRIGGEDFPRMIPMGTTAVVALTRGNVVQLAALGDSRAWIVGRSFVAPLLPDHNLGTFKLREAVAGIAHRWEDDSAALTGYVGHFDPTLRPQLCEVWYRDLVLLPGEWLVLASDGLSDYAAPEEAGLHPLLQNAIAGVEAGTARGAMALARDLVRKANDGGGGDNVTVLVLTLSRDAPGGEADPAGTGR